VDIGIEDFFPVLKISSSRWKPLSVSPTWTRSNFLNWGTSRSINFLAPSFVCEISYVKSAVVLESKNIKTHNVCESYSTKFERCTNILMIGSINSSVIFWCKKSIRLIPNSHLNIVCVRSALLVLRFDLI